MVNFDFDGLMGAFGQHDGKSADGLESIETLDLAFFQAGPDYVHLSAEEQQSSQWASNEDSALIDPAYFDSPFEESQLEEGNTKLSHYPLIPMDGGLLPPFDPNSFEWTYSSAAELTSDDMGSTSPPYHVVDDPYESSSSSSQSSEPPVAAPTQASGPAAVSVPPQAADHSPIQSLNSAQLTVNAIDVVKATDANPLSELATAMAEIERLKAELVKNTQQIESNKQTKSSPKGPKTPKKGPASKFTASSISPRKRAAADLKESPPKKSKQLPPAAIALAAEVGPIEAKWSPKHKTFQEANTSLVQLVPENFPQVPPPAATKKTWKRTKTADLSEPKKQPPLAHLPQPPFDKVVRQSVEAMAQSIPTKPKKWTKPTKPLKATCIQQKKQISVPHPTLPAYDGFTAVEENVEENILQSIEIDENDPFSIMMRDALVQELHGSIIATADSAVTPQAEVNSSFTQAHGPTQDLANAAAYATYHHPPASSSTLPQQTQQAHSPPLEAHHTTMSNPVEHTPQKSVEPTGWTAAPVLRQRTTATPAEVAEPTNDESTFELTITPDETVMSDVESEYSYPSGSCIETMATNPPKHSVSTKTAPVKTTLPHERPIEELMKENFHSLSDVEKVRIFLPLNSGYEPRDFWETETWDPTLKARQTEAKQAEMALQNKNQAAMHQAEKHAQQQNAMRTQAVQLETQAAAMYTHAAAMQAHAAKLHANANRMQIGYGHAMTTGYGHPMQTAYGSSMQTGFGQFNETPEQFGARRQREAVEKSQRDATEMARRIQVQKK